MNNNLFLIFLNLLSISAALIPVFIIHGIMFCGRTDKKKIIVCFAAAFIILPAILYICYKKIFITSLYRTEDYFLFIFGYTGIIAINYLIFLSYEYSQISDKTKPFKMKYYLCVTMLIFMIYLSVPTFLTFIYSKKPNETTGKIAEKISLFPIQKKIIKSYTEKYINIFIYPEEIINKTE